MSDHSTHDQSLRVGDIVTAYVKGYWRVVRIERRFVTASNFNVWISTIHPNVGVGDEFNPLFYLEMIFNSNFTKRGKKTCQCDAQYCHRVDKKFIDGEVKLLEKKIKAFREMQKLVK